MLRFALLVVSLATIPAHAMSQESAERPRARDLGIEVGVFEPGTYNAITDVGGVLVGHSTVVREPNVRTGVTAILPHGGNPYRSRVPAAIHVANGFGKLLGVTQVRELGEIETPILLTCTLCVWRAADAMAAWMLERDGMEDVRSINPVVGETNDGGLNDIRSRPITAEDVIGALERATDGAVAEGSVGAGAGTSAFGWKGGIGTSSRILPSSLGGYTVGVLVQSNFGGILQIAGAPVGIELGRYAFADEVGTDDAESEGGGEGAPVGGGEDAPVGGGEGASVGGGEDAPVDAHPGDPVGGDHGIDSEDDQEWGSIMIVVATDAPLSDRNLERLARRAVLGLARTGSYASNGSGDYVIAFSTANDVRRTTTGGEHRFMDVANTSMSALFEATVEATEESIYNSLFRAETVTSNGRTVEALPLDATVEILERYGVIR